MRKISLGKSLALVWVLFALIQVGASFLPDIRVGGFVIMTQVGLGVLLIWVRDLYFHCEKETDRRSKKRIDEPTLFV